MQQASSSGSLSGDGFKSNSEYSRSQLEASAAQKDGYFARKMQVRQLPIPIPRKGSVWVQPCLLHQAQDRASIAWFLLELLQCCIPSSWLL